MSGSSLNTAFPWGKELFYWVRVCSGTYRRWQHTPAEQVWWIPSAVSFTVWKELNPFEEFSCFMDITFNISVSILGSGNPSGWNRLKWILFETEEFTIKTTIPIGFLSNHIRLWSGVVNQGRESLKCFQIFALIVVCSFYWSPCKAKVCKFLSKQRENLTNQNMIKSILTKTYLYYVIPWGSENGNLI